MVSYKDAGVDIAKGNAFVEKIKQHVSATQRVGADTRIGGFGGLFDLAQIGYLDPILVAATDGVGTKLKVAIDAERFDTIGIDLVAMCVNDLIVQGAEPLFFLDYFATSQLNLFQAEQIVKGISVGCIESGCALIGGETAEMPGLYARGDFDLAGFAVGIVERNNLLPRKENMHAGHAIVGLSSSGVHSNGYSLVRKVMEMNNLNWNDAVPFDRNKTFADIFLEPTKLYVKPCLDVLKKHAEAVFGLAHITGGGIIENIPRVLPEGLQISCDTYDIPFPPVFEWLHQTTQSSREEMLTTFNCGIGMVMIVAPDAADDVIATLHPFDPNARVIGYLEQKS